MSAETDFARLWEPGLSGVELFSAHLFRHSFGKHFHEAYTIGLNDGGQGGFRYRGETRCTYPHSFNLINPGEVHTGHAVSQSGWWFRNLYLSVSLVESILAQLEWSGSTLPYFAEPVVWDPELRAAFCDLFQVLSEPESRLTQESLLLQTVSQLIERHAQPGATPPALKAEGAIATTRAYLEDHYAENISLVALAHQVGLSPYYLIRSFHQQVGLPPHAYQRQWQLLQAKAALRTSQPLTELALAHGFYDQSHLTRHFKRVFGVTPGQYRREVGGE